ncbi:MAG: TetR/AcrR family transcriptional regulator [Proteobacteria bacterium]|nr:TetR/AcrR family transcriptional regulator [Pseudomonadota bacterium]
MPRVLSEQEVEAFRSQLCKVALRLFAEQGYAGVTLRALAAEMGCSPMTPYRYFADKEEIFEAVRRDAFERFSARVSAAGRPHRDPVVRLRAMGREYVRFAREEPHAYRIMFQLEPPASASDPQEEHAFKEGWSTLEGTLREAVANGQLAGDPLTLAHLAWVGLHGCVTLHVANRLRLGRGLDELVDPVSDNFVQGATARPPAEDSP